MPSSPKRVMVFVGGVAVPRDALERLLEHESGPRLALVEPSNVPLNPLVSWSHDRLARELKKAREKRDKASARRRDLPPGSSRANVTTANARWSTACEAYDRLAAELRRRASAPGVP